MYIAYTHCGIERKHSVHFFPNLMSENHITGKAEARAQAGGMLQAGSNQAYVAEAVKIIFESSERLVEEEVISKIPCG
jgi:hypothetical protein